MSQAPLNLDYHRPCLACGDPDFCERLRRRIDERMNRNKHTDAPSEVINGDVHGLRHRFREQNFGHWGPEMLDANGVNQWDRHADIIRGEQDSLQRELRTYEEQCGPPPPGAWALATRPVEESEWRGPESALLTSPGTAESLLWSDPCNAPIQVEIPGTGLPLPSAESVGYAAGATGAAYLGYRAVRLLPSLLAPPTLIPNLVIP